MVVVETDVAVTVTHALELAIAGETVVMFDVGIIGEGVDVLFDVGVEDVVFVILNGGGAG